VAIEVINGIEIDLDDLHDDLAELKPLIRRWAQSDPLERETAIRAASTEDLTALWAATQPRFPIITGYLEDPDDTAAELLDNLVKAAIEAVHEIERRTGTDLLAQS
jgi:hypothetical protein